MLVAIKINVSYLTTSDGISWYLNTRSTLGQRTGCSVLYTNSSMEEHRKLGDGSFNPEQCDNDSEARRGRPPAVLVNHSPSLCRTGLTERMGVSTNPLEKPMLLQNRKPPRGRQQVWREQVMGRWGDSYTLQCHGERLNSFTASACHSHGCVACSTRGCDQLCRCCTFPPVSTLLTPRSTSVRPVGE